MLGFKGQGALEYLMLIGGAVLIAIVVIGVASGFVEDTGKPNPNEALCQTLTETRCKDDFTRDVDGDATPDCTWVTSLSECHACKTGSCPATS